MESDASDGAYWFIQHSKGRTLRQQPLDRAERIRGGVRLRTDHNQPLPQGGIIGPMTYNGSYTQNGNGGPTGGYVNLLAGSDVSVSSAYNFTTNLFTFEIWARIANGTDYGLTGGIFSRTTALRPSPAGRGRGTSNGG